MQIGFSGGVAFSRFFFHQNFVFRPQEDRSHADFLLEAKTVWVDKELRSLTLGSEHVLTVSLTEGALNVQYGKDWEAFIFSAEHEENKLWKEVLDLNTKELQKKSESKGIGKGKAKS